MTFEKKYLKYKEKYLNLKNKNIKGGNIFSIPPCDRELDRKYHSGLWDPQNPLTKTDFDVRNNVILSLLSESMKKRDNMPKNVWDKLFNMAYNNKNDIETIITFLKENHESEYVLLKNRILEVMTLIDISTDANQYATFQNILDIMNTLYPPEIEGAAADNIPTADAYSTSGDSVIHTTANFVVKPVAVPATVHTAVPATVHTAVPLFEIGSRVKFHNLNINTDLNGLEGNIMSFNELNDRYVVRYIYDGKIKKSKVKPENITKI